VPPSAPVAPVRPSLATPSAPAAPVPAEARAGGLPKVPSAASNEPPTVVKPTVKKDTVRIEVPPGGAKVAPQATVRIQQTQPLIRPPEAQVRTLAKVEDADVVSSTQEDPVLLYASLGVLVFAAITFGIEVVTYVTN
jgi:hypothetical protein